MKCQSRLFLKPLCGNSVSDPISVLRTTCVTARSGGAGKEEGNKEGPQPQTRRQIGSDTESVPLVADTSGVARLHSRSQGGSLPPTPCLLPAAVCTSSSAEPGEASGHTYRPSSSPSSSQPALRQVCLQSPPAPRTAQVSLALRGSFLCPLTATPSFRPLCGPALCLRFICLLTYQSNYVL